MLERTDARAHGWATRAALPALVAGVVLRALGGLDRLRGCPGRRTQEALTQDSVLASLLGACCE
jgi:hypothetical protein